MGSESLSVGVRVSVVTSVGGNLGKVGREATREPKAEKPRKLKRAHIQS